LAILSESREEGGKACPERWMTGEFLSCKIDSADHVRIAE
jgi:hypothetical protein